MAIVTPSAAAAIRNPSYTISESKMSKQTYATGSGQMQGVTNGTASRPNLANVDSNRSESHGNRSLTNGMPAAEITRDVANENALPGESALLRSRPETHILAHRPRQISRTKTDLGPSQSTAPGITSTATSASIASEEDTKDTSRFRHGWDINTMSSEYLSKLTDVSLLLLFSYSQSFLLTLNSLRNIVCIMLRDDTTLEASHSLTVWLNPQTNGEKKTARRLSRQLWFFV